MLLFKSGSYFGLAREVNKKSLKLVPFVKTTEKCGGVPKHIGVGLNIFISYYNYTSIQIYMMIIQAMGLERKLKVTTLVLFIGI